MEFSVLKNQRVYLDHNATTPLSEAVSQKIHEWLPLWGNPSSIHWGGRGPKTLIREARQNLANMLGVSPLELVFTSGGTEANNTVIKGVYFQNLRDPEKRHRTKYLFSAVEHPSVTQVMGFLRQMGCEVYTIPVNREGELDLEVYESLVDEKTALVSAMMANNETGSLLPLRKMVKIAHEKGALFHADAVQALGKIPLNIKKLDVDFASFSAHKFYALKGAGAYYCKSGLSLPSSIHGGRQERRRRGGTENVLAIAAFGEMALRGDWVAEMSIKTGRLRDHLEERIHAEIPRTSVTGDGVRRLPNTSSMVIPDVDGETLLMALDLSGFAVSTGAACSSGNPEPSPVLLAMGLSRREAQSSLRVSLGWGTTKEEIDGFVDELKVVVQRLREIRERGEQNLDVNPVMGDETTPRVEV